MDRYRAGGINGLLATASLEDAVDLTAMTKAELLAYAADHGVTGVSSSMTKAKIIETIESGVE